MTRRGITDQAAHFTAALVVLSIATHGGVFGGAVAGLACGLIRETAEGIRRMTWDSVRTQLAKRDAQTDLVFWTMGGLAAALIGGAL